MLHPYKSQINGEAVAGAPNTGDQACSALARLVGNGCRDRRVLTRPSESWIYIQSLCSELCLMSDTFTTPGRRSDALINLPERLKITGFSSPAADYECLQPSIDEMTGIGAPHIFLWRLKSEALAGLSLHANDTLVVNRQAELHPGRIAVVVIDGEHRVCLAQPDGKKTTLVTVDASGLVTNLEKVEGVEIWGVVDYIVRDVRSVIL